MKLSHLSLAILSALALTACGGGGSSNHTTPDGGANKPVQPEQPKQPEVPQEPESPVVDPTQNDVVVAFELDKKPSVGELTYIRQKDSKFNINKKNEGLDSAATAMVSLPLESQNPHLTNIVLGNLINTKIAQFAGSIEQDLKATNTQSLQTENFKYRDDTTTIQQLAGKPVYLNGQYGELDNFNGTNDLDQEIRTALKAIDDYNKLVNKFNDEKAKLEKKTSVNPGDDTNLKQAYDDLKAATDDATKKKDLAKAATTLGLTLQPTSVQSLKVESKAGKNIVSKDGASVILPVVNIQSWVKVAEKYHLGSVTFEQAKTNNGKTDAATTHDSGLVTIDYTNQAASKNVIITGTELDNVAVDGSASKNIQTTRIFGHYYLDPSKDANDTGTSNATAYKGNWDENENVQILNSYKGAAIAVKAVDGKKELVAIAQPLNHVQYGRVTANVDPDAGEDKGRQGQWTMKRVEFRDKGELDSVDYYFARGTYATSLAQMDALPRDTNIEYRGHALLWGVDNRYNYGKDLPNAFGTDNKIGLGNFVKATLNMGDKTFKGNVYNAWVDYNSAKGVTSDKIEEQNLISFSGDVVGNSVVGTATRLADKDDGDLRASFFGAHADEVGGSFNSVTAKDVYGNTKWGGVFGAKRVEAEAAPAKEESNKWLGDAK